MKPSQFKISISVESYDEKTAENYESYDEKTAENNRNIYKDKRAASSISTTKK